jgi:ACS family hexuronate transporter-like MFS transporter
MYVAVALTVILINIPWHFYRAWMPLFLEKFHGYNTNHVAAFTMLYYLVTDVGCLGFGFAIGWMARNRVGVHSARMIAFAACAVLTLIGSLAGVLPGGPALLVVLIVNALGSLALFPIYYSLTQELSSQHQGKVTGTLSCLTWICTAVMQLAVGDTVQRTNSYKQAFLLAGIAPVIALVAILVLWPRNRPVDASQVAFH